MLSTQKILITCLTMNIIIGIALLIANNPTGTSTSVTDGYTTILEEHTDAFQESPNIGSSTQAQYFESSASYINILSIWGAIGSIIAYGFNPLSGTTWTGPLETLISAALTLIRSLWAVVLGLEIWFLWKGKYS